MDINDLAYASGVSKGVGAASCADWNGHSDRRVGATRSTTTKFHRPQRKGLLHRADVMPAFWSQTSDIPAPLRCDTPQQIVAGLRMRQALGLSGGQLIANPVPKADEISAEEIGPMIELALHEAHRQGISAKAVTPFLLDRIFELTAGSSLQTNISLVKNNARLAAQIAKSCCELPKS